MSYNLQELYEDTKLFNLIAGKAKANSIGDLQNQLKLIQEELDETRAGINHADPNQVLDGAMDVAVTLFGLIAQLESLGIDVNLAAAMVAKNNLSKFIPKNETKFIEETINKYDKLGTPVTISIQPTNMGDCVVFRNSLTNKVLKPANFQSVDISNCIPKGFKFHE